MHRFQQTVTLVREITLCHKQSLPVTGTPLLESQHYGAWQDAHVIKFTYATNTNNTSVSLFFYELFLPCTHSYLLSKAFRPLSWSTNCCIRRASVQGWSANGHIKMSAQSYTTLLAILYGRDWSYKIDVGALMST